MGINQKLEKIQSIIESCKTYEQVLTCFSFVNGAFFNYDDILTRYKVLGFLQKKAYEMRSEDLKQRVKAISNEQN